MTVSIYVSVLGLWVQCAGAFLIAVLFWTLARGETPAFHRRWALGWSALALALACLGFSVGHSQMVLLWAYQFLELFFVFNLWQGARLLEGRETDRRVRTGVSLAAGLWTGAVMLSLSVLTRRAGADRISAVFAVHALVMGLGYGLAAAAAAHASRTIRGLGPRILTAGLASLSILFVVYSPLTLRHLGQAPDGPLFMSFSGFLDGLLQFAVAFAMLLCRTESDQRRLSAFNVGLADAHRELEQTYALLRDEAERDPLTDAHNRLAFRRYCAEVFPRLGGGAVALIDMNSLKAINDRHGHEIGDRAIRLVADAIRGLFRPGEPLFRWGGDEFLLLLPGSGRGDTLQRLSLLNSLLEKAWDGPRPAPQACFGVEEYDTPAAFEQALKKADGAMYDAKRTRVGAG